MRRPAALLDAVGRTSGRSPPRAASSPRRGGPHRRAVRRPLLPRPGRGERLHGSDRAVEGRLVDALEQFRWALATGVPPVLITSALAQGIRLLGRVGAAPRGKNSAPSPPRWARRRGRSTGCRQQLRGWAPEGIAHAIQVVAEADAQIKGKRPALALPSNVPCAGSSLPQLTREFSGPPRRNRAGPGGQKTGPETPGRTAQRQRPGGLGCPAGACGCPAGACGRPAVARARPALARGRPARA